MSNKHQDFEKSTKLTFENPNLLATLCGPSGINLKTVEHKLGVTIKTRGNECKISGEAEMSDIAAQLLVELYSLLAEDFQLHPSDVARAIDILKQNRQVRLRDIFLDAVCISSKNRLIAPKSLHQKEYVEAIKNFDLVFGIGPAGTGKTYLAMAMAVTALSKRFFERIILARPAVEAGEKLGFLPGDMTEKVNPYLRPLYDALHDLMPLERATNLIQKGIIEVAPLAFMRGRTLNDSFVILDEAQNTTPEQMKMFLTRLGFNSKAVVTGDVTQIDLENGRMSGLIQAQRILRNIPRIKFCTFTEKDVVRHPLVQDIILAYEHWDKPAKKNGPARNQAQKSSQEDERAPEQVTEPDHSSTPAEAELPLSSPEAPQILPNLSEI